MSTKSNWVLSGRYFKQTYEGAYRYLDKCGEFMLAAEEKFNFIPNDEAKPTGCGMYLPEGGIEMHLDTGQLTFRQIGADMDQSLFNDLVLEVPLEVERVIAPRMVVRNGIAVSFFKRMSEEDSFKVTCKHFAEFENKIADKIGMNPEFKKMDLLFVSGSYRVNVKIHPAAVRSPSSSVQVAQFQDSPAKREHIQRRNEMNRRNKIEAGYGLVCEIDLMENLPPANSLERHLADLDRIKTQVMELMQ